MVSPFPILATPSTDVLTQNCRKLPGWHIWSQFLLEIGPISGMWSIQIDRLAGLNMYFHSYYLNCGVTFLSLDLSVMQICPKTR